MVYCNQKVVLVDFKVFDTRSYPLFLDDELFHINIDLKDGKYTYGFLLDKESDTPRNKARRLIEQKHWKQTLLFVAALVLAVSVVTVIGRSQQNPAQDAQERAELILHHGKMTECQIEAVYQQETQTTVRYSFMVDGKSYSGRAVLPQAPIPVTSKGLPVQEGDLFAVRFVGDRPSWNDIQLDKPTEAQLSRYRQYAIEVHTQHNPDQPVSAINCLLDIAYAQQALSGYASIIFQDTPEEENPLANELTYKRLVRSVAFQNARQAQCL